MQKLLFYLHERIKLEMLQMRFNI